MASLHNEESLKVVYDMCNKEYQSALLNCEKCISKSKDYRLSYLDGNKSYELLNTAIKRISSITTIFREFNRQMEGLQLQWQQPIKFIDVPYKTPKPPENDAFEPIKKAPIETISKPPEIDKFQLNQKASTEALPKNVKMTEKVSPKIIEKVEPVKLTIPEDDLYTAVPTKYFNFPKLNLDHYFINYQSECIVTHIREPDNQNFFITDYKAKNLLDLSNFFNEKRERLLHVPHEAEIFGYLSEGAVFRAVKKKHTPISFRTFTIFLIDLGEILEVNIDKDELYKLSKEHQKPPSQIIFCSLDKLDGKSINRVDKNQIYEPCKFIVKKIRKKIIYIDLISITNPFHNEITKPEVNPKEISSNPFGSYNKWDFDNDSLNDTDTDLNNSTETDSLKKNNNFDTHKYEFFDDLSSNNSLSNEMINDKIESSKTNIEKKEYNITEEERKILYDEPKSTSNALEAIMGYVPKDEQRICKFYDPDTKGCFKGGNCKLQHLPPVDGGWSREALPTKISIAPQLILPVIGEEITIIPTHVENVDSFWGQIIKDRQTKFDADLRELNFRLNSIEYVTHYKVYERDPVHLELVFALYCDQLWYRAQVVNIFDDQMVKVKFLDYGNCSIVPLSDIRKWDNKFDYLPFKAVNIRINNITRIKENHIEAIEELKKIILNRPIIAKVKNNKNELSVILLDSKGFDVGEILVSMNLAKMRKSDSLVPATNMMLPG